MASGFPRPMEVIFKDTRGCGGIVVRGIALTSDKTGCVSGPADLEADIAPHGFVPLEKWFAGLTGEAKVAAARLHEQFAPFLSSAERATPKGPAK